MQSDNLVIILIYKGMLRNIFFKGNGCLQLNNHPYGSEDFNIISPWTYL